MNATSIPSSFDANIFDHQVDGLLEGGFVFPVKIFVWTSTDERHVFAASKWGSDGEVWWEDVRCPGGDEWLAAARGVVELGDGPTAATIGNWLAVVGCLADAFSGREHDHLPVAELGAVVDYLMRLHTNEDELREDEDVAVIIDNAGRIAVANVRAPRLVRAA